MMAAMSAAGVYRRRSFVAPSSGVGAELSDVLLSAIRFSGAYVVWTYFLGSLGYSRSTGIYRRFGWIPVLLEGVSCCRSGAPFVGRSCLLG